MYFIFETYLQTSDMDASLASLIVQVGLKLINYFQSRLGQSAAKPKTKIDELAVGGLVAE